jgi:hypothetical protein
MHNPLDAREPSFIGLSIALRRAKADERAAKLAPLIKALQAAGVTS